MRYTRRYHLGMPGRVCVVALGGTIAMTPPAGGGPVRPELGAAQLAAAIPGLDVDTVDLRQVPGAMLTPDDVLAAAEVGAERVGAGAAGIVVTQGTDTIEETAYLLDLVWDRPEPVVVTGAMRHPSMAGPDGPANVLAAVRVAADPAARGYGCLVVMSDEIHAARWVQKTHSTSVGTFASPAAGPLGQVVEGVPRLWWPPAARVTVPGPRRGAAVPVALVVVGLGDAGELLSVLPGGYGGVVVAGFGAGHVPAPMADPLEALATRIPVVLASRTGTGPVLEGTYGFVGSESDLLDRGLIPAGFLDPYKARVLLQCLLGSGADRERIAATFRSAGGSAGGAARVR
jgi:L-asparaginase